MGGRKLLGPTHHVGCARVLKHLAVHCGCDAKLVRINTVGRHNSRAKRTKGIERLRTTPLATAFASLPPASTYIIRNGVPGQRMCDRSAHATFQSTGVRNQQKQGQQQGTSAKQKHRKSTMCSASRTQARSPAPPPATRSCNPAQSPQQARLQSQPPRGLMPLSELLSRGGGPQPT